MMERRRALQLPTRHRVEACNALGTTAALSRSLVPARTPTPARRQRYRRQHAQTVMPRARKRTGPQIQRRQPRPQRPTPPHACPPYANKRRLCPSAGKERSCLCQISALIQLQHSRMVGTLGGLPLDRDSVRLSRYRSILLVMVLRAAIPRPRASVLQKSAYSLSVACQHSLVRPEHRRVPACAYHSYSTTSVKHYYGTLE